MTGEYVSLGTVKHLRDAGFGCSKIAKKLKTSPGRIYYLLRKHGLIGKPTPKKILSTDFNAIGWQVLMASVAVRGGVRSANGTRHIYLNCHKKQLKRLVWLVKLINSIGFMKPCKKIYLTRGDWCLAEFHSKEVGMILESMLKDRGSIMDGVFHPAALAIHYLETGRGSIRDVREWLEKVESTVVGEWQTSPSRKTPYICVT